MEKKRGGQLGNKGGKPRTYRIGTKMTTVTVPCDDSELIRSISKLLHKSKLFRESVLKLLNTSN